MFLQLLLRRGQGTDQIFFALFEANPITRAVGFLEERLSLLALVRMVLSLPRWGRFLAAVVAWMRGRRRKP